MKFVVAVHGTRGDVEPCAAVGLELWRRGHDVCMAVPPNLVGFVESAGLAAVPYGRDSEEHINAVADYVRGVVKMQNPISVARTAKGLFVEGWAEMSRTLTALADSADLVLTGVAYHGVAANVAEYYGIPVAALHHFPMQVNGRLGLPSVPVPPPLIRSTMRTAWWLYWQISREVEQAQRRELGLPKAKSSATQRIAENGSLEIQAYDEVCFPGLAAEWNGRRPFVGALTLDLASDADDEVASWIAAGTPPIYFSFGSTPVKSRSQTLEMIAAACAELGERALVYSGVDDTGQLPSFDHVKVVGPVNYTTIFPACRAVVHHGGAGTTAAVLRAGIPALVLWEVADQPLWAAVVTRLKVGSARRLSGITQKSLVRELREILAPGYVARARDVATRTTKPAAGASAAATLLEDAVRDKLLPLERH
ncbi:glycosyltransferase [Mycobacterium sp.]|uniref:glycosyltransferase n=1 Tax=Mycobacterium sp. TaxID=1785 RepID=UPI0031D0396A